MASANSAVVLGQLSDKDLREKLQSFGEKVGPVTVTTRKVLEKKLQKLLDTKNDKVVSDTNEVHPSGNNTNSNAKKAVSNYRGKRASLGRRSTLNNQKFAPFSSDDDEETNDCRKSTTKPKDAFVDPNDSPNIFIKSPAATVSTPPNKSTLNIPNSLTHRSKRRSFQTTSTPRPVNENISMEKPKRGEMLSSYNNEFSDDDYISSTSTKKSPMGMSSVNNRSMPAPNTNAKDINVSNGNKTLPVDVEKETHKFLSPCIKTQKLPDNSSNMRDEIDASLIQIRKSFVTKKPSPTRVRNYEKNEKYSEELDSGNKKNNSFFQPFKSLILCCIPLLFIALLGGFYMCNWNDKVILGIANDDESGKDTTGLDLRFINCLYFKLSTLVGNAECGYTESKWVKSDLLTEFADSCWEEKAVIFSKDKIITALNESFSFYFEINEEGDISSKTSSRSLICRINQALSVIAYRVIIVLVVIGCFICGYFIMKKRWTDDDEEMRQILHFVERIIDTLQRHHEVCQTNKDLPPFLPIPHVRDMLIPLSKRKKLGKLWKKAVSFLNSSDSRVRVETQRIAGEDFDVWRWIGVCTPKLKKEKKATNETYLTNDQEKYWQGPAFDEIEKVVRMPIVTPTPCLKIRYMHEGLEEKDEKWVRRVENAVLEKCSLDGAQILHIYVDKTSKEGCVYVKCDSLESAGKAFRCMYGNWFDCRLVTVKFVTLARYHQRFPDALKCVEPLKSDSNMPSSLNWVSENNK